MNITTCNIGNTLIKEGIVFAVLKMRKLGFLVLARCLEWTATGGALT